MAEKITSPINLEHQLEAVRRSGSAYELHFRVSGSKSVVVKADLLVLTLPFSVLRDVELSSLNFSPVKMKAINELSYGKNAKLFASYSKKVWRDLGYNGNVQSDEAYQLMWDNSQLQEKEYGGLTFYSGGRAGINVGEGTAESQVRKLLPGVERTFPNSSKYLIGKFDRFHWPSHAFTKGSYAAYKPGQWTSIRGAEIIPEDRIFFAGEHCSLDFQGFMNGAAESGRIAAQGILSRI
jgi:monoamine oxidase